MDLHIVSISEKVLNLRPTIILFERGKGITWLWFCHDNLILNAFLSLPHLRETIILVHKSFVMCLEQLVSLAVAWVNHSAHFSGVLIIFWTIFKGIRHSLDRRRFGWNPGWLLFGRWTTSADYIQRHTLLIFSSLISYHSLIGCLNVNFKRAMGRGLDKKFDIFYSSICKKFKTWFVVLLT